jgi:twinkle protein
MSDDVPTIPRLIGPITLGESLRELWDDGLPPGDKTGWPSLDALYTVAPGQLTIVTGWPSSGKSEWVDALLINLSRQGWKFAVFSPENQPIKLHVAKMLEKLSGKPFGAGPTERIRRDEVAEYIDELGRSFAFVQAENESPTIEAILLAGWDWLSACEGKRGFVIDPYNEIEHWRPQGMSETEYISKLLSTIRNFARANDIHIWLVAHPQKLKREEGKLPIPTPDTISGSQNFWNKADNALTVWRDLNNLDSRDVTIFVQKVRFKHIGKIGSVILQWDRISGRYHEPVKEQLRLYGDHRG